ncbi:hypothetical protein GSI_11744 [Ganoderma sinense ZZ0214-1]|uniref:Uncharacterized protein n=1 Tax=Ganoderma sinense ZZ0214-1 TaxID=1077348 RepID=A0A2G8RWV1_9APHY|nr:hypothetical protein GSI_11744 [Ganoderma sinense ZZ0214-1]
MRDWVVPYEALSGHSNLVVVSGCPFLSTCYKTFSSWLFKKWILGPCDIEVWDWKIGKRLRRSHYSFNTSFTLLDDAHRYCERRVRFSPWVYLPGVDQYESRSSIPSPRSPGEPFWIDRALWMVVVKLATESALLIPYKTFLHHRSAALMPSRKHSIPGGNEPLLRRLAWEDWSTQAFRLVGAEKKYPKWSFEYCHSYGSSVVVNADGRHGGVMFDLNPWAARNARRFPKPSGEYEAPKELFSTEGVTLPHGEVLNGWYHCMGLGQSTPGLATDPMGFTEVYSMSLRSRRFLGSISHYV